MKVYHILFFLLNIVILGTVAVIYLFKLQSNSNLYILIDSIFKFSFGLFLISYFLTNNEHKIHIFDRMLIVLFGMTLLCLVDYNQFINIVFNTKLTDPFSISKNK